MSSEYTAYFRAQLLGADEALAQLKTLYDELRRAKNERTEIRIETRDTLTRIEQLRAALKEAKSDLHDLRKQARDGIQIETGAIEKARANVRSLNEELNAALDRRRELKVEMREAQNKFDKVQQRISEITHLLDQQYHLKVDADRLEKELQKAQAEAEALAKSMEKARREMEALAAQKIVSDYGKELLTVAQNASELANKFKEAKEYYDSLRSSNTIGGIPLVSTAELDRAKAAMADIGDTFKHSIEDNLAKVNDEINNLTKLKDLAILDSSSLDELNGKLKMLSALRDYLTREGEAIKLVAEIDAKDAEAKLKAQLSEEMELKIKAKVEKAEAEELEKSLERSAQALRELGSKQVAGNASAAVRALLESSESLEEKLRSLNEMKADLQKAIALGELKSESVDALYEKLKVVNTAIDYLEADKKLGEIKADRAEASLEDVKDKAEETGREIEEEHDFNISTEEAIAKIQEIGSAIESIGGALSSFGDFIGHGLGGAFSSMAGIFDTNIGEYAAFEVTRLATDAFMNDWSAAAERFDILDKYNDYMEIMGISAERADASLEKINKNIQGLPVGLSDVAYQARRYTMFLDYDLERATDLAVGLNKALIAGGAPERMRNTAMYEVDQLLAVGKLNTVRQWNSLFKGLGISVRYLQEEMGLGNLTIQEFAEGLTNGTISTEEFLKGLEGLADSTSLEAALSIYRDTIESGLSNIKFALTRGKANIIDAVSETLESVIGMDISDAFMKMRDGINNIFMGITDYIRSNPKKLAEAVDIIIGIVERIKSLNWSGLADKVFENLTDVFDAIIGIFDRLPEGAIEEFIAFAITKAGPLGTAFQAISDGLPLMLAVFERFKDYDFGSLADRIFTNLEKLIDFMVRLMEMLPDSVVDALITFGLVWAGPLGKAFSGIGRLISILAPLIASSGLAKFIAAMRGINAGSFETAIANFKTIMMGFAGLAALVAVVGEVGLVIREFVWVAEAINDLRIDDGFAGKLAAITGMVTVVGAIVSGLVGAFTALDLLTGHAGSLAALIGEGLVAGLVAIIGEFVWVAKSMTELAQNINDVELPSVEKISRLGEIVGSVMETLNSIDATMNTQKAYSLTLMGTAVDAIVDTADDLKRLANLELSDAQITAAGDKVVTVGESIARLYQVLDDMFVKYDLHNIIDPSAGIASVLTNMKNAISVIGEIATQYSEMDALLGDMTRESMTTGDSRLKASTQGILDFVNSVGDVFVAIKDSFTGENYNELGWAETDSGYMSNILTNMQNSLGKVKYIAQDMGRMQEELHEFTRNRVGGSNLWNVEKDIGKMVDSIGNIFESIRKKFTEGSFRNLYTSAGEADVMDKILQAIRTSIGSINAIAVLIPEVVGSIRTAMAGWEGETLSPLDEFSSKLDGFLTSLDTAFKPLVDDSKYANLEVLHDYTWKVESLSTSLEQVKGVVTKLLESADGINQLVPEGQTFELGNKLNVIFTSLATAFSQVSGENAIVDVSAVAEGFGSLAGQIEAAAGAAETLIGVLGDLIAKLKDVQSAAEDTRQKLSELNSISLNSVTGQLEGLGGAASAARTAVENLRQQLLNIPKYVQTQISIKKSGSVSIPNGAEFKASGGIIPWRKRGTDTVPAMLTPGEFVMKRAAVNAFGKQFMSRINSLDIDGAFRSLTLNAGASLRPAYAGATTNNYRDNHANVTQNIYTNNPNFANRRMSRYVKSL